MAASSSSTCSTENNSGEIHSNFGSLPCFNVKWGCHKKLSSLKHSELSRKTNNDGGVIQPKKVRKSQQQADLVQPKKVRKCDIIDEKAKPWNLRARRRALCHQDLINSSPRKHGGSCGPSGGAASARPRAKFSVSLTKQEIQDDFLLMMGTHRPSSKTLKKRPNAVQKHINVIFPGFGLSKISVDKYKVNEH